MAYYENLKCGKCGYSFTGGYVSSNGILKTYMGVPYVKCKNCGTVNNTGFKPYSTFHWIEKLYHWFSIIFRYSLYSSILGFLSGVAINKYILLDENIFNFITLVTLVLFLLAANTYAIINEKKEIEFVEKEYEKIT